MNDTLRIVPKIDLSGFEHRLVDRTIRLRNGVLDEPAAPTTLEAVRADRQQLQGVWGLVSGSVGGRPNLGDAKVRWTVRGDQVAVEMADRWVAKSTLDPSRSPKRINLAATSADGATEIIRGVYEVRGDRLCVCLAFGDEPRPESLRCGRNSRQISLVLKRQ